MCYPVNFAKFLRTPLVAASEYLTSVVLNPHQKVL